MPHAQEHGNDRADQGDDLHEPREAIGKIGAAIGEPLARHEDDPKTGHREKRDGKTGDHRSGPLAREDADHEQRKRTDREDELRNGKMQACKNCVSSHVE
ncbi:hypothetical protein RHSP_16631 [Rhizobium freirei PRF 81]|uniref:Uncharacterized protein n=1 Tax=Rhizobium freirei PRF 81 TaxID=363754 RepID=N6UW79_9HYPH|nr:hypothetical protein RHSP_16631 [Rhizobium freirei PRF 81]